MSADALSLREIIARLVAVVHARPRFFAALIAIDAAPVIALEFAPGDWSRC